MPLDPRKKKKVAELLLKGLTYEEIWRELGVSSEEIAEVSHDQWTKEKFRMDFAESEAERCSYRSGRVRKYFGIQ